MKDWLCRVVTIAGVIGGSLVGWFPKEGSAKEGLVQGQEIELTECSGWLIQNSTAPAIEGNAVYWFVQGMPTNPPGGHFRFRAEFPRARYMSWQNHDLFGNSTALLADTDIVPDRGENPFLPNIPYSPGSSYTVDLLDIPPEARISQPPRPSNILYGGYRYNGLPTEYNSIAYRVYVSDLGTGPFGGVSQPDFYFVVDDPSKISLDAIRKMCTKMHVIQESEKRFLSRIVESAQSLLASQQKALSTPRKKRLGQRVIDGPSAKGGLPRPLDSLFEDGAYYQVVTPNPNGQGVYFNIQTGYLGVLLDPSRGEVTVMRFKAPSFPDTQGIQDPHGIPEEISGDEQLRYWSLCMQNTTSGLATTGCLYDAQVTRDSNGYVTFAFSNPEHRPANATQCDQLVAHHGYRS